MAHRTIQAQTSNTEPQQRSEASTPGESSSGIAEPASAVGPALIKTSRRHGTGPRTREGKEKSKKNATKHGIFSSVIVLDGESRSEYQSLLNGLRAAYQPEGTLEEVLVEKLATLLWRTRRLLHAEAGEIAKGVQSVQFIERDLAERQDSSARELASFSSLAGDGLVQKKSNPRILEHCLLLLQRLCVRLEEEGALDLDRDANDLKTIYGRADPNLTENTFFEEYITWYGVSTLPEKERQSKSLPSPAQCCKYVLLALRNEIHRLRDYGKTEVAVAAEKARVEVLRRSIPEGPGLEHLLRYETSLDRGIDRTLSQLERQQRMRRGQPVAPRIDVSLTP